MVKLTAAEYRAMARGAAKDREDSFDRCDTDGFVTQWADGLHSSLYQQLAILAEADWVSEFPALFYIDTTDRVPAKIIYVNDRYSYGNEKKAVWAIVDPKSGKFTGQFVPVGLKSRKQKQFGMYQGIEYAPAFAKIDGTGYGLSGSAWVSTYRTDDGYPV